MLLPQQNKVKRKTKETVQLTNETNKEEEWMRGDYLKNETLVIKKDLSIAFQSLENIFVVFCIYKAGIIDLVREQQGLALFAHNKSSNSWKPDHTTNAQEMGDLPFMDKRLQSIKLRMSFCLRHQVWKRTASCL